LTRYAIAPISYRVTAFCFNQGVRHASRKQFGSRSRSGALEGKLIVLREQERRGRSSRREAGLFGSRSKELEKPTPSIRKVISSRDIAWVAGFLEGEGCFSSNPNRRRLRITANQVDYEPLTRLLAVCGGSVIYRHRATVPGEGHIYIWEVGANRAAGIMLTIYSLMSRRRQGQIRKALEPWMALKVQNRYKTHCKHGHEFATQAWHYTTPSGKVERICLPCRRVTARQNMARRRAKMAANSLQVVA
jgi:hypothetical protein